MEPAPKIDNNAPRPASGLEVEKFYEKLVERLEVGGFFWPDHKAASMKANLRNLLSRLPLNEPDTRMLHGIVRALSETNSRPE